MNERIKELKNQTLDKHFWYTWSTMDYDDVTKFAEKFAELLIRECAEVCKSQEYDYWRSSEDQDFTPQDCADAIEQHFGVEK